jgi:hypothetical protein
MNPDEIAAIRLRIKERLQNMGVSDNKPYENDINTKAGGFPIHWLILALAIVAILATLRGC